MPTLVVGGLLGGNLVTWGLASGAGITATFLGALRARLLAAPGLEDVPIYIDDAPAGTPYPLLILSPLGDTVYEVLGGDDYVEREVQVTSLSMTRRATAQANAEAAYDALEWDGVDAVPLEFTRGYEMARSRLRFMDARREPQTGPRGESIFKAHFDVRFLVGSAVE